jgi:hypothetical protein
LSASPLGGFALFGFGELRVFFADMRCHRSFINGNFAHSTRDVFQLTLAHVPGLRVRFFLV